MQLAARSSSPRLFSFSSLSVISLSSGARYEFDSILSNSGLLPACLPPSLLSVECDRADGRIRCWMLGQGNLRNDRFTTAIYAYVYTRICIAALPALMEVQ